MEKMAFTPDEKAQIVHKVKLYFERELDQQIGGFEAEFLIEFFADEVGAYFYNRGLNDAQAHFVRKFEEISDSIYELEQSVDLD